MQLGRQDTVHSDRVIALITLSENEEDLRSATNKTAKETELDKFLAYGYGSHYFGVTTAGCPKENH